MRWRESPSGCSRTSTPWVHQGSSGSAVMGKTQSASVSDTTSNLPGVKRLEMVMCQRLDRIEHLLRQVCTSHKLCDEFHEVAKACEQETHWLQNTKASAVHDDGISDEEAQSREKACTPMPLRKEWRRWHCDEATDSEAVVVKASRILQTTRDCAVMHYTREKDWWILLPSTKFRILWDIIMMFIIAHDMAVVPVTLAFETGENAVSEWLFWPFMLYWTVDLALSFVTGYYTHGQIEVRTSKIAMKYCQTWFLIDIFVLVASWMEVWLSYHNQDSYLLGRAGKTLRVLRVLRAVRIVRLAKIQRVSREFEDQITSEYLRISINVFKLILTIMWLNHFVACVWWTIGVNLGDAEGSWTTYFYNYETSSLWQQYFTSLHWSLTQFTPASMEISARSLAERMFSVAVLLFAMVTFSSFVSSITTATTQLRDLTDYRDQNFAILRRYLHGHRVPMDLAIRILHCVEYRLGKQKSDIPESQVDFLALMSKPLQMELSLHMFSPLLTRHPFFSRYSEVDSVSMRRVCIEAVSQVALYMEDLLFTEGSVCEQMFFTLSGVLHYTTRKERRSLGLTREPTLSSIWDNNVLQEGCWCCEVCLWSPWVHRGTMVANQTSEVVALRISTFTEITSAFPLIFKLTTRYAALFLEKMNESLNEGDTLDDMSSVFSTDSLEEMVERAYLAPVKGLSSADLKGSTKLAERVGHREQLNLKEEEQDIGQASLGVEEYFL